MSVSSEASIFLSYPDILVAKANVNYYLFYGPWNEAF